MLGKCSRSFSIFFRTMQEKTSRLEDPSCDYTAEQQVRIWRVHESTRQNHTASRKALSPVITQGIRLAGFFPVPANSIFTRGATQERAMFICENFNQTACVHERGRSRYRSRGSYEWVRSSATNGAATTGRSSLRLVTVRATKKATRTPVTVSVDCELLNSPPDCCRHCHQHCHASPRSLRLIVHIDFILVFVLKASVHDGQGSGCARITARDAGNATTAWPAEN